ncbi:MAG: hypothetical protein HY518_03665 [Candidatus Aenigmarchaeota archaeon]|nr:hypothetical protein [Candidatus Aenigmarchaeota archaeon]
MVRAYEEDDDEEYEVIPATPLRRLEKRLSRMESTTSTSEVQRLIEQIIELIKSNQRVIDDVIKANTDLRDELSRIPGKVDELVASMREFLEILKASVEEAPAAAAAIPKEAFDPLVKKIDEFVQENRKNAEVGQAMLTSLNTIDKRLKRLSLALSGSGQGGYQEQQSAYQEGYQESYGEGQQSGEQQY